MLKWMLQERSCLHACILARSFPEIVTCCLCEKGADIKLLPCGHVALCHNCVGSGQGAKKCPQMDCRVRNIIVTLYASIHKMLLVAVHVFFSSDLK